jgi:hypothetical protein
MRLKVLAWLLLLTILPLTSSTLYAQQPTLVNQMCVIVQVAGQQASYTCTFKNPALAGDTIVFPEVGQVASIADPQGGTWIKDVSIPQLGFWHKVAIGGETAETITMVSPGSLNGVFAEYPPSSSVTVSAIAHGTGTAPLSASLPAPAGAVVIGFGSQWTNSYQGPSAAGTRFSFEADGGLWLEDQQIAAAGTPQSSATYSAAVNWFTGVAVLNTAPPPPPPPPLQSVNFTFSGTLTWSDPGQPDDGSPIAGSVQVSEYNPPANAVWNTLGTATPDASGNISGTVSLSTNFADFPTIQFVLLNAAGVQQGIVQQGAPGAMFGSQAAGVVTQTIHGITGFKLIISKPSCAVTCQIAPGTVWGTLN